MNTMTIDWPDLPSNVHVLSTLRGGGVSTAPYDDGHGGGGLNLGEHVGDQAASVAQNRARLRTVLPTDPAWITQVHGTLVVDAARVVAAPSADASFTTQAGIVCAVMTADCLPVLFCDKAGQVVAAAHAGWRGLASGVLQNTLGAMRAAGAGPISAWLGPAIGPQQFEVGDDERAAFITVDPAAALGFVHISNRPGKYFANIYLLARQILERENVLQISGGTACTMSEPDRYFSFRRDQHTGRMATMIWRS